MELTLQVEPVVVKDEHGNVVLESPLLDLHFICGNILAKPELRGKTNEEMYEAVAEALNERFCEGEKKFTWGSACLLITKIETAINDLKKNGELQESNKQIATRVKEVLSPAEKPPKRYSESEKSPSPSSALRE